MNENVLSAARRDKAETLRVIEPLHGACFSVCHWKSPFLLVVRAALTETQEADARLQSSDQRNTDHGKVNVMYPSYIPALHVSDQDCSSSAKTGKSIEKHLIGYGDENHPHEAIHRDPG